MMGLKRRRNKRRLFIYLLKGETMHKRSKKEDVADMIKDNPDLAKPYLTPQTKAKIAKEYLRNQRVRQTAEDVNEALRRGWITLV